MTDNSAIKRVGILGGSFNPAHEGHVHVSRLALDRLSLDQVWWMVSPQNPLKPVDGMATFDDRFESAEQVSREDSRILVSDIEKRLEKQFTAETLPLVCQEHPNTRFVWIMGADNLPQMEHWENWSSIFHTVPIAVFARPPYDSSVLTCTVATRFADSRHEESRGAELAETSAPAWIYFDTPLNPKSATQIRSRRNPENGPGS